MKYAICIFAVVAMFSSIGSLSCYAEDNPTEEIKIDTTKPLVVFVYDKSCKISCGVARPILKDIQSDYADKVQFVELDVSKDTLPESRKTAKSLGVLSFLSDSEDWYPAVGVFSAKRKMVKQLLGARTKAQYVSAIEKAIASKK